MTTNIINKYLSIRELWTAKCQKVEVKLNQELQTATNHTALLIKGMPNLDRIEHKQDT